MSAAIVERFSDRFSGLTRTYGSYWIPKSSSVDDRGKLTGKAKTVHGELTVQQWQEHLNGKTGLGITPIDENSMCRFGAIDIDVYDLKHETLEQRIKSAELPLVLCRTKSGGAHLYLFLSEPTKASLIRSKLLDWSILVGYPGHEVFPKQNELGGEEDCGSWINIPYFDARHTMRYAIVDGKALSVEEFLDYADKKALTSAELAATKGKIDSNLEDAPPCLQHLALSGFPEGTRNTALYNLGILCKMKFGDDWANKLSEFNNEYVVPPLQLTELTQIINQLDKKDYFYKCKEPPLVSACNKAVCVKRKYGLDKANNDPGVILTGLVKVLTDPPMWFLNVNEKRVKLVDSEELLRQHKFERVCLDSHNILPNRVKDPAWRDIIRTLMEGVEEVPAPEDAGAKGQFMFLLERFCTARTSAESPDELLMGKVYNDSGKTYFMSHALLSYLDKERFKITSKEAWAILREEGAEQATFAIGGKSYNVWSLPEVTCPVLEFKAKEVESEEVDDGSF